MKHLFVVAVATGIFTGTSHSSLAQASINLEKYGNKASAKASLNFIDGIEITPERIQQTVPATDVAAAQVALSTATPQSTSALVNRESNIEQCSSIQFKFAMMLNAEVEIMRNIPLYRFIEEWWGTRYRYGGTDKKGIDCSSFASQLTQSIYGVTMARTAREQYRQCKRVNTDELLEGDLVFFNTRGGVSHVGVYLMNRYFVHSSVHGGVTISSLDDPYYHQHFISGGRPPFCEE